MKDLRIPLGIDSLEIESQESNSKGEIIITVTTKQAKTPCHKCGKPATKPYGYAPYITIKHTSILDTPVYLRIRPVRYQCERCDDRPTTQEKYDWCADGGKVTKSLEKYLIRCMINNTVVDVAKKENIGYRELTGIMNARVNRSIDWDEYTDLHTLGIDEISLLKGHGDFITIVSTKDKMGVLTVVAVLEDRKEKTVKAFFDSIPEHLKKTVQNVCTTDMYDGFVYPAIEYFWKTSGYH